ncbi:MAG: hypothetical protein HYS86_03115 [Candidatus Chisholmbacteria bacterium]|nr:hypothetical protein [Candidatus Chisholmbacteria bacterium]
MKIYAVVSGDKFKPQQLKRLEQLGELRVIEGKHLSSQEVVDKVLDVDILITGSGAIDTISESLLQGLKNLKFISLLTVGVEWVDVQAAQKLGIKISTIKGANAESVAEHTWGMILDLTKRISEFDRDARLKGAYKFADYKGKEIYGKTLGIIGLGDIGQKVARIAQAFKMQIIGTNKGGHPVPGVKLVNLPTLLKDSDVICFCVPLTPETENLIGEKELAQIKPGAILVNTAREKVINKQAVLNALNSGKLFGYGIETEIMQPVSSDDLYFKHPRVVLTPHNAFNTEEAEQRSLDLAITNVEAFITGKPQNLVA